MKRFLILLATICCCGCSSIEKKVTTTNEIVKIRYYKSDMGACIYTIEIENHKYIVYSGNHGGGIIHAEHCQCKNK